MEQNTAKVRKFDNIGKWEPWSTKRSSILGWGGGYSGLKFLSPP